MSSRQRPFFISSQKDVCQPNETVIACEIKLQNPSILLIRLGSNDAGAPDLYDESMRQIVAYAMHNLTALMVLDAMINEIILPAQN